MSSSIIKTNYTSAQSLTTDQLTALVIGAFASYPAGTLLVRVAGFLTRDKIDAAAGGYLHLTSHFKQSRMRLHLHYLWHEAFANDSRASTPPAAPGVAQYNPGDGDAACVDAQDLALVRDTHDFDLFREQAITDEGKWREHDGFIRSCLMALRSPLPMGIQSERIGFHLGPVEDWYEKGFFAYEDFPAKAFARDPLIKRTRALVDSPLRVRLRRLLASDVAPSFWYAFTVRKFASALGKAITTINEDAERSGYPDYFDAQHFIWPSEEMDEAVRRRFGPVNESLVERFFLTRRRVMREVFSDDAHTARRHLMRMFARDYAAIFEMRLKFDPAWAAGRLDNDPLSELDAIEASFSLRPLRRSRVTPRIEAAIAHLDALDRFMETVPPGSRVDPADPLTQVAAHIDYRGFRSRHLEGSDARGLAALLAVSPDVTRHIGLLRELLQRVRIYHALIKIQILDYWTIIHRMADID